MINSNPTETRVASIFKDEKGVLIITMKNVGKVDEYDVVDIHLVMRHKTDNKPALKLFDARGSWYMDKKAKERSQINDSGNLTLARAIVVSNSIKVSVYKYLLSFNKKDYPQKFFTDKKEAYDWLVGLGL